MKFTPGIAVGAMSGSIGGTTFSHNKGGPYARTRAIPTNPSTQSQLTRRAALATHSQNWRDLTDDDRQSWTEWARQNPITNTLGQSILKSGHQSFVGLNSRISLDAGTSITVPPIVSAPPAFTFIDQAGDIGTGSFNLTFSGVLEAGNKIELWGALINSAGVGYVENLVKFIAFSPADQATPWDNESDIASVLGTITAGQTLHIRAAQYDPLTGLRSPFLNDRVVIIDTV